MRLIPQENGMLKLELEDADRGALNTAELLGQLIEQHESSVEVQAGAAEACLGLRVILDHYRLTTTQPTERNRD